MFIMMKKDSSEKSGMRSKKERTSLFYVIEFEHPTMVSISKICHNDIVENILVILLRHAPVILIRRSK